MEDKSSVAFVLIDCDNEFTNNILDELKEIDSMKEFLKLESIWKIIIKLEADDINKIREIVRWKIRKIPEIKTTLTLVEYM